MIDKSAENELFL